MTTPGVSETAFATVSLRALSNYEEKEELRSGDNLAEIFIPKDRLGAFATKGSREAIKRSLPPGLYEYVIARTRFFDSIFVGSRDQDFEQIVMIGAGYDSRPYRYEERTVGAEVFEVDSAPTQERKRTVLSENGVAVPDNVTFVPMDLEKGDILERLMINRYDRSKKTLFLLEGVSFYLTERTMDHMLRSISSDSGAGSQLCLDLQTVQDGGRLVDTGLKEENTRFGIPPGKIDAFIQERGLRIVQHLDHAGIEERYLISKDGARLGTIAPMMHFLRAEHD